MSKYLILLKKHIIVINMNIIAFQIFCIEFYAKHIQKPGNQVYLMFRDSGLMDMLETDYEDLHGLGTEAMMQFCDRYLGQERRS